MKKPNSKINESDMCQDINVDSLLLYHLFPRYKGNFSCMCIDAYIDGQLVICLVVYQQQVFLLLVDMRDVSRIAAI